jgi:hypothetical protein
MSEKWLEDLKAGDTVISRGRYDVSICKIERLTKTLIITKNGRFRKSSGRDSADSFYGTYLYEATPDALAKARHEILMSKAMWAIRENAWDKMPDSEVIKIYNIIKESKC